MHRAVRCRTRRADTLGPVHIEFQASERASLGIEVELTLVSPETGELVSAASELLEELGRGHPDGLHPKAKHELFECCVEVITGICATPAEAKVDLAATIGELRTAAAGARAHAHGLGEPSLLAPARATRQS